MRPNGSWWFAAVLVAGSAALLAQSTPSPAETAAAALLRDAQLSWRKKQFDDALAKLTRLQDEFRHTSAAADAGLWTSRALTALGDPIAALEDLQQIRTKWPKSPSAVTALAQSSVLRRLYARPATAPAYGAYEKVGTAPKLEGVTDIAVTGRGGIYRADEKQVAALQPAEGERLPAGVFDKPRLILDAAGNLVIVSGARLAPFPPGQSLELKVPRPGKPLQPMEKIEAAAQLSTGEWLVMDPEGKAIQRFGKDGTYSKVFESAPGKDGGIRVSRLAVNTFDEVAGLDDDGARIVLFDPNGDLKGAIPYRRRPAEVSNPQEAYELKEPRGLAFDIYGHLYVLDQKQIAIFSPYGQSGARGAARPGGAENRGDAYRLKTLFAETPEKGREGFKAVAFALDQTGAVFLYDEGLKQVLVYR